MADLSNPRVIKAKGLLFLLLGFLAATLLLIEVHSWRVALLLSLTVWAFCRFYYFAFYVIQHYVDAEFRFAGLWAFARYLLKRPRDGAAR